MPTTTKSSKKTNGAATTKTTEAADVFAPFYVNTVTRVAELQKNSLDAVADQTTEFVAAWKKAATYFPVPTPTFFFDVFGQAVQTVVETQKSAIDLAVEQTEAVAQITKQRANAYAEIAETVASTFPGQATIEHVDNPRVEAEGHYYNVTHSRLEELGLNPTLLSEALIDHMFDVVERHKDRVDVSAMMPTVDWRATASQLPATASELTPTAQ